jgi:ABC-2 type transport system ATP-binding protein
MRARGKTVFLTTHLMEEAERLCDRVAIIDHGRLVDIGAPAALVRRHCPVTTLVLAVDDPSALARFEAIPGVESVRAADGVFTIRGRADDLVTAVVRCLAEHRLHVRQFHTEIPTLEDVFLQLTGHAIRD